MYYLILSGNYYIISIVLRAQNGLCDILNLAKCINSLSTSSIIIVSSPNYSNNIN